MNETTPKDDDQSILYLLTLPRSPNQGHAQVKLSQNHLSGTRDRLIADITSPVSGISNGKFWNDIVDKASSLGFNLETNNDSTSLAAAAVSANNTQNFSAPFDTTKGKYHLEATAAILGVTQSEAMRLTKNIFLQKTVKQTQNQDASGNRNSDSENDVHELIGTQELLLLVRDYHYSQQIERLRIITEALRLENAEDDEDETIDVGGTSTANDLRTLCVEFLNRLDKQDTWKSSSRGGDQVDRDRGIFRLLVSIACAPVSIIGRDEIYRACELSCDMNMNGNAYGITQTSTNSDFARNLMERHWAQYNLMLRTEALEALFMLIYQRIDGGIDRADYVILLLCLDIQNFFADGTNTNDVLNSNSHVGNRNSQLTALILAECMGLWRTAMNKGLEGNDDSPWIKSHPFLHNPSCAFNELQIIGKLLLDNFSNRVLERRRIHMMQSISVPGTSGDDDDSIDAPEAIAMLTFGILMKLSHRDCSDSGFWASDMTVKGLAVDCVSKANDDCGAFGYLKYIMSCLLMVRSNVDTMNIDETIGGDDLFQYQDVMLDKSHQSRPAECPLQITNGGGEDLKPKSNSAVEGTSALLYTSIGREILVATLSAFRSSVSRNLSSAKVDNLGMFCHLASKIHDNSSDLCQKFWSDWESTPQGMDLSEDIIIASEKADPLVYLLDVAHSVAIDALHTLDNEMNRDKSVSADDGRQEANILPCLSPLLSLLSSLISAEIDLVNVANTFIPNGMILSCLRGCNYICSNENSLGIKEENKRLIEAARTCMGSLRIFSSFAGREKKADLVKWLRHSTQTDTEASNVHGAHLLYCIAEGANRNPSLEKSMSLDIASDALYTAAHLCMRGDGQREWTAKIGQTFSSIGLDGFRSFASRIDKVAAAFTFLVRQLALCLPDVILDAEGSPLDFMLGFMNTNANGALIACDIISSSTRSYDLSDTHLCILMNSMRSITIMLRIVNGIAASHQDDNLRVSAIAVREGIISALATSTSLGSNIGFFSTAPILKKSGRKAFTSNVREGGSLASQLDKEVIFLSSIAMKLLKVWSDTVEKIAVEVGGQSSESISAGITTIRYFTASERASMARTLASLGPSRLLFSSANISADYRNTFFCLLTRYIEWSIDDVDVPTPTVEVTALVIVDLLTSVLRHGKLSSSSEDSAVLSFEISTSSIASTFNQVLFKLMNAPAGKRRRTTLLLRILEFLQSSITSHPSLGNLILTGTSNEDNSLIDLMVGRLNLKDFSRHEDVLVASSCLQVFKEAWNSCRRHCGDSTVVKSVKPIHPCDDFVGALVRSEDLIQSCISIVNHLFDNFNATLHDTGGEIGTVYYRCTIQNILRMAIHIIKEDASFHLRTVKCDRNAASIAFLNEVAGGTKLVSWLNKMKAYDGILTQAKIITNVYCDAEESNVELSPVTLDNVSTTMLLVRHYIPGTMYQTLANFHASRDLFESQSRLLITVAMFGELALTATKHEDPNFSAKMMSLAIQAVDNLHVVAENGLAACSQSASSPLAAPVSQAVKCGNILLNLVLSCLSQLSHPEVEKEVLVLLLDKVLRSTERLLVLAESSSDDSSLQKNLRLNTGTCAISFINIILDCSNSALSYETSQLFKATRLRLCQFSSETLRKLKSSKSGGNSVDKWNLYYSNRIQNGDSTDSLESSCRGELDTLHSAISLLTTLAINTEEDKDRSLIAQSFHLDLVDQFINCRTLDLLSYHLEMASNAASELYLQEGSKIYNAAAFETVQQILSFVSVLCDEKQSSLSELVTSGRFFQLILKNSILIEACEKWNSKKGNEMSFSRGYIEISDSRVYFASKSHPNMVKDPAHEIWRGTLRTIASLLHSTNSEVPGTANVKIREHAATLAIDFLHFFEVPITTFIETSLSQTHQSLQSSNSSAPSSGLQFTVATMGEMSDILALVSELCSREHGKFFQSSSSRLYQLMSRVALAVCRSVSSLLGALGTAREIFAVLHRLNEVMGKDMNQSAAVLQYQNYSNHPLLADGINNAKHQAIRNALYASSCCSFVTEDEYYLSPLGQQKDNQDTPADLEQAFHSQVSNDFIYLVEDIASQCMLSALTIIHNVHPSLSSFVTFTEREATQLNLSTAPQIGAMVGIRSGSGSQFAEQLSNSSRTIRYGRVIHYNAITKALDVEFFDKLGLTVEKNINSVRLAALEDVSKRFNMFNFNPAPESVSDDPAWFNRDASLGNLILILRWCQQHASAQKCSIEDRPSLQVKGIANISSIILGNEIGTHIELGSPTFGSEQDVKRINSQILSLFDDEENFDLSTSKKDSMLEHIIEINVWTTVQSMLESCLHTARIDRNLATRNAIDQGNAMGTQYWARTPPNTRIRANRRSPFL